MPGASLPLTWTSALVDQALARRGVCSVRAQSNRGARIKEEEQQGLQDEDEDVVEQEEELEGKSFQLAQKKSIHLTIHAYVTEFIRILTQTANEESKGARSQKQSEKGKIFRLNDANVIAALKTLGFDDYCKEVEKRFYGTGEMIKDEKQQEKSNDHGNLERRTQQTEGLEDNKIETEKPDGRFKRVLRTRKRKIAAEYDEQIGVESEVESENDDIHDGDYEDETSKKKSKSKAKRKVSDMVMKPTQKRNKKKKKRKPKLTDQELAELAAEQEKLFSSSAAKLL